MNSSNKEDSVAERFTNVALTCIDAPLLSVRQAAESVLLAAQIDFVCESGSLKFDNWGLAPKSSGAKAQAGLFPVAANHRKTAMIANVSDGWYTLANCISIELKCRVLRFTFSRDDDAYPMNGLQLIDSGKSERCLYAMRDTKWEFYQEGAPLSAERPEHYRKRRIKDRVSRQYIFDVAERLGYDLKSAAFWESAADGFILREL